MHKKYGISMQTYTTTELCQETGNGHCKSELNWISRYKENAEGHDASLVSFVIESEILSIYRPTDHPTGATEVLPVGQYRDENHNLCESGGSPEEFTL